MTIPIYLFYFIAAGTVAVLVTILYGLNRALADAHWPAADRTWTLSVAALILLGWLAVAITLSALGTYQVTSGDRPTIQYGILLPILIGADGNRQSASSMRCPSSGLSAYKFFVHSARFF